MSDNSFPYIPLSRLRELKQYAQLVCIAIEDGSFGASDLWRLYVGMEVNSFMANHWYSQLEKARNYIGVEAYGCPLCVYDNGKLIALCELHKQIGSLHLENNQLRQLFSEIAVKISTYFMSQAEGAVKDHVEEDYESIREIGRIISESKGNSEGS